MNLPKAPDDRLVRAGLLLVLAGLIVQIVASFFWSPGTFIVSAVLGVPPVTLGALLLWLGVRRSARAARAEAGAQVRKDPS
jgi:uncharacterized membrane protein